jgi:hypothetical protein
LGKEFGRSFHQGCRVGKVQRNLGLVEAKESSAAVDVGG